MTRSPSSAFHPPKSLDHSQPIRSVLQQTFDDFELIVCDNSDEAFMPATAAAAGEANDPRVRYVRTNGRLSMPDNWERAIADARGDYVGILTDRSVYRRDALSLVHAEIEHSGTPVVGWFPDSVRPRPSGTIFKRGSFQDARVRSGGAVGVFAHDIRISAPASAEADDRRVSSSVIDRGVVSARPLCPRMSGLHLRYLCRPHRSDRPLTFAVCALRIATIGLPSSGCIGRIASEDWDVVERPVIACPPMLFHAGLVLLLDGGGRRCRCLRLVRLDGRVLCRMFCDYFRARWL